MSDIVKRLRGWRYMPRDDNTIIDARNLIDEAADEIERLNAELAAVRGKTLEEAATLCDVEAQKRLRQSDEAQEGSWNWGEPKRAVITQGCMHLTASGLAKEIRNLISPTSETKGT